MSSTAPSPSSGGSAVPPSPVGNNGTAPSSSSPSTQIAPSASPPAKTPSISSPPPTSSPSPPVSPTPVSSPPSPGTVSPPPATAPPPPPIAVPPTVHSSAPPPNSSAPPPSSSPPVASPPSQSPPPPTSSSPRPASSTPPIASPPPPTPVNPTPPPTASPPSNSSSPIVRSPVPSSTPSPPPPSASPSKSPSPPIISSPPPPSVSPSKSPSPPIISSPPPSSAPTLTGSPPPPGTSLPASPTPPSTSPPPPPNSSNISDSTPPSSSSGGGSTTTIVVGAAVAGLVILALCGVLIWYIRKKKRRDGYLGDHYGPPPPGSVSYKSDGMYASVSHTSDQYRVKVSPSPTTPGHGSSGTAALGVSPSLVDTSGLGNSSWFTYEELAVATNGFSPQNVLGEGGFGCVYKGYLPDGQVVAVKQLKVGSGQGEREFRAEVEIISRVHHRHLVSLVGYCISDSQRLLVYDYVPNGTLEYHLHGEQRPVMDWATRMRIAVGAARGLAYLHEDCHPKIIHRDIKGSNILLDDRFEAQVSDFGLAKLASDTNTHVTTRVMGTFGYMAPEYASSGKLTVRSDVFSFGVVLLELVTGRKPVDISQPLGDESLVEWARPLLSRVLEDANFEELADPRLENNFDGGEMFRMVEAAAACVRHSARRRPGMGQVVRALESNAAIADLNNGVKPGQSVMYDSAQYSADIRRFRRMAFGSQDNASDFSEAASEYETTLSSHSNEFRKSKELEAKQTRRWKAELGVPGSESPSSGESETRPINRSRFYRDETSEKSSGEAPINFKSLTGR